MNGETSTQAQKSVTERIEPTAADVRDIAQKVVDKSDTADPKSSNDRLAALEKSHADLIAKLARHFPALF